MRLQSRIRLLELALTERPSHDDVAVLERTAATRLADAQARAAELETQLARVQDTVVSERVEQLVARVRALEIELAERPSSEEVAELQAKLRNAQLRVADAEAAAAAAASEAASLKVLPQKAEAPAVPPSSLLPTPQSAAAPSPQVQRAAPVPADGIESQLRRIESLLLSLPALPAPPDFSASAVKPQSSVVFATAAGAGTLSTPPKPPRRGGSFSLRKRVFASQDRNSKQAAPAPAFVRAPPESFTLRRHVFY